MNELEHAIEGLVSAWTRVNLTATTAERSAFESGVRRAVRMLIPDEGMSYVVTEFPIERTQGGGLVLRARARRVPQMIDLHVAQEVGWQEMTRGVDVGKLLNYVADGLPGKLVRELSAARIEAMTKALERWKADRWEEEA